MRLRNVDLNLFVVFDVVYSERNLTRAAEVLHITQPAVTNALNRLRKNFSDPLFIRGRKEMLPTPVADNIIGLVREALQLLAKSVNEGEVFEPSTSQKQFHVAMNDAAELTVLSPMIGQLLQEARFIGMNSFSVSRSEIAKELAAGSLDLAIDAPLLNDPNLLHAPLMSAPYVCLMRKGHPMCEERLTMKQYLELKHVHISSRRQGLGHVDAALNQLGMKRKISLRMRHYMVAPEVVAQSDMVMTAPSNLVHNTNLTVAELPFDLPPQNWHLYWHLSADHDEANKWLREQIFSLRQNIG